VTTVVMPCESLGRYSGVRSTAASSCVRVDEAGGHHLAAAVDDVGRGQIQPLRRMLAQRLAHGGNAVAGDQHIAGPTRAARAVHQQAAGQQCQGWAAHEGTPGLPSGAAQMGRG
jgi:hypothetical protein